MYKRPTTAKPEKEPYLKTNFGAYGFINTDNDPGWISPYLQELMDDGNYALSQFLSMVKTAKEQDMSDYKPEIAAAKKAEMILKGKRALMTFLTKHIEKYKSDANAVSNAILRVTEPSQPSDQVKALLQELRFKEIRDNLRNIDPKHRRQAIAGNLERIKAIVGNPDPGDIIISEDSLTEIRREYAFSMDSTLAEQEKDQREIYKAVRARAADINATATKMLIDSKLNDPTPPAEHFAVFEPQDDHERAFADKRILSWQRKQAEEARLKQFESKRQGLNMEIGARAERRLRQ